METLNRSIDCSESVKPESMPSPRVTRCTNTLFALLVILIVGTSASQVALVVLPQNAMDFAQVPTLKPGDELFDVEWGGQLWQNREMYVVTGDTFHRYDSSNKTVLDSIHLNPMPGYALTLYDIAVDDIGNAYLAAFGTNRSFPFYDRYQGRFSNFTIPSLAKDEFFTSVIWTRIAGYGFLIAGCGSNPFGVGFIDCSAREIAYLNASHGLSSDFVTTLKLRGNALLVGTSEGFNIVELPSRNVTVKENRDDYNNTFAVRCIEYYPFSNRVFVGTDSGLLVYEIVSGQAHLLHSRFTTVDGLPDNSVNCLERDDLRKRVYVGTNKGLCYINLDENAVTIYPVVNGTELSDYRIKQILIPTQEGYVFAGASAIHYGDNPCIIKIPVSKIRLCRRSNPNGNPGMRRRGWDLSHDDLVCAPGNGGVQHTKGQVGRESSHAATR